MNVETDRTPEASARLVAAVTRLLDLDRAGEDRFHSLPTGGSEPRLFGGQVVAQALVAASRTVPEDRTAHSLHGYFLRPGDPALPTAYIIQRLRDGGSFSTRAVVAFQGDTPIFSLSASFHIAERSGDHQTDMPEVAAPESLQTETAVREAQTSGTSLGADFLLQHIPIDLRPVRPRRYIDPVASAPRQEFWFRPLAPLPDDPLIQRAFLAYVSDWLLLSTALLPHGVHWATTKMQSASLDHSLWIHAQPHFDDWMLYVQESPWSGGARGLARGMIYSRAGHLIASVAQEGLMRWGQKPT